MRLLAVTVTEVIEEGDTVIDDGIDVRDMSDEAIGESMPLVIDRACDVTGFSEEDGRKLEEPAGFAGEAVNDRDDTDGTSWREWRPPLCEDLEAARVGDEGGGLGDGMLRVELIGGERAEGVVLVSVGDWMQNHFFVSFQENISR